MATEVERLVAVLEARMTQYDKALKKAVGDTDQNFRKIEKRGAQLENRLSKLGKGVFVGFGAGAVQAAAGYLTLSAAVQGAKDAMAEFGNIADQAAATGLDAEFLQGLAYQASLGGVAFDELSGSLATFSRNSALAVEGKGKMVAALKALNPALLESVRAATSNEERIRLVADALETEQDASRRAAIATAAFGDAGAKIASVLAGGSASIDAFQQKAKDLGIVVSRELIAKADELGDEFDTVTKVLDIQLKQALINLGPLLVWLTGLAAGFAKTMNFVADSNNPTSSQSLATLETRLKQLRSGGQGITGKGGTAALDAAEKKRKAEIAKVTAEIFKRADYGSVEKLTSAAPPVAAAIPTLDDMASRDEAAKAAIRQAEAVKDVIADLEFEQQALGKSAIDQKVMAALRQAGAGATDAQRARIEELVRSTEEERRQVELLQGTYEEFADIGKSAVRGVVDAMKDGTVTGEELGNVLSNIADRLTNLFLDNALSGITGDSVGGFFKGLFGRAAGGTVNRGQAYTVGERGPELFVPGTAGTIVPTQDGSGGTGGALTVEVVTRVEDGNLVPVMTRVAGSVSGRAVGSMEKKMAKGGYRAFGISPGLVRS